MFQFTPHYSTTDKKRMFWMFQRAAFLLDIFLSNINKNIETTEYLILIEFFFFSFVKLDIPEHKNKISSIFLYKPK